MKRIFVSIAAGLAAVFAAQAVRAGNFDGDVVGCAVGLPCIRDAVSNGSDLTFTWQNDPWDKYHVRWFRIGEGTHTADVRGGSNGSFTIHNAHSGSAYSFSIEGCITHIVGHDRCSPWTQETATAGLQFGSDTCKPGFVWRDAVRDDHVCVTTAVRNQAVSDNRAAAARRQPGGDTCKVGFVWRGASAVDHVCVIPQIRAAVAADNQIGRTRRLAQ